MLHPHPPVPANRHDLAGSLAYLACTIDCRPVAVETVGSRWMLMDGSVAGVCVCVRTCVVGWMLTESEWGAVGLAVEGGGNKAREH